jgi:FAD:protein FMN transferase
MRALHDEPAGVSLSFHSYAFTAMASRCEVRAHAPDELSARHWADAAIAEVRRIEAKFSRYRDDSIVTRINRAAGKDAIAVDDETAALLTFGAELHRQSGGLFDLTSGVLRRAWDFKAARVPTQASIDALLPLVGWSNAHWTPPSFTLPQTGMEIDFGGIGKEYAADRAAAAIEAAGGRHALVNLGGDIRVVGAQPDGAPWRIGVQDPRGKPGAAVATLDVVRGAMATSGDYERFFERDGRRYCHLLDPRSGWPVAYWRSISVLAPVCVAAGACATLAMLRPVTEALAFLNAQGVRYLAIDAQGERYSN